MGSAMGRLNISTVNINTTNIMNNWFFGGSYEDKEKKKQQIKKMFALADKDNDGKLTISEWKEMLLKTGAPVDEKEIEKFFAEKDRDFDGRLSLEEFLGEETQIEKLFRLMDKNDDGLITKKEFMTICTKLSKDQVKLAFAQFDTSGDDKLDYREFCEMIRQKEESARN